MFRLSGQEVVTSGRGRRIVKRSSPQLWASPAPPSAHWGHRASLRTLPGGHGTVLHAFSSSKELKQDKKGQKENLSKNDTSFKE